MGNINPSKLEEKKKMKNESDPRKEATSELAKTLDPTGPRWNELTMSHPRESIPFLRVSCNIRGHYSLYTPPPLPFKVVALVFP